MLHLGQPRLHHPGLGAGSFQAAAPALWLSVAPQGRPKNHYRRTQTRAVPLLAAGRPKPTQPPKNNRENGKAFSPDPVRNPARYPPAQAIAQESLRPYLSAIRVSPRIVTFHTS